MTRKQTGDRQRLGEILEQLELITGKQLDEALSSQGVGGHRLGDILVRRGAIAPEERDLALAIQAGAEILEIRDIDPGSLPT